MRVEPGTTLNISGNADGKFINTASNSIVNVCGGQTVVDSGYFESDEYCFFVYTDNDSAIANNKLTINGGTFKSNTENHTIIFCPGTGTVVINGGTFYDWNPSTYVDTSVYKVETSNVGTSTVYTVSAK